jgi:hypothetical protein
VYVSQDCNWRPIWNWGSYFFGRLFFSPSSCLLGRGGTKADNASSDTPPGWPGRPVSPVSWSHFLAHFVRWVLECQFGGVDIVFYFRKVGYLWGF